MPSLEAEKSLQVITAKINSGVKVDITKLSVGMITVDKK